MAQRLDLVNDALVRIGADPIASEAEANAQALAVVQVFDNLVGMELSTNTWAFALREKMLPQLSLDPQDRRWGEGENVYQVPIDFVRAIGLRCTSRFRLIGDQVYTDANEASLLYIADIGPEAWPPYFNELVVFGLAAALAVAVTDSASRSTLYLNQLPRVRARAQTADAQQMPPFVFDLMRIYAKPGFNPLATG